jgi:hypothetical protein
MVVALLKEKEPNPLKRKVASKPLRFCRKQFRKMAIGKVVLKQTYGNGDAEDSNFDLVKQDGTWKIVMDK